MKSFLAIVPVIIMIFAGMNLFLSHCNPKKTPPIKLIVPSNNENKYIELKSILARLRETENLRIALEKKIRNNEITANNITVEAKVVYVAERNSVRDVESFIEHNKKNTPQYAIQAIDALILFYEHLRELGTTNSSQEHYDNCNMEIRNLQILKKTL